MKDAFYEKPALVNFVPHGAEEIRPGIAYRKNIIDADTGGTYRIADTVITGTFPWMSITNVPFENVTGGERNV